MQEALQIITFKWDAGLHDKKKLRFSCDHVNKLYNSLKRNLTIPFTFTLITDEPEADIPLLDKRIDVMQIWDWGHNLPKCYRRLFAFSKDAPLENKVAWIDIDVVITGNCDDIFSQLNRHTFVSYANPDLPNKYNGSLVMWYRDMYYHVFESFDFKKAFLETKERNLIGSDQAWLDISVPNGLTIGKYQGIYSYRRDIKLNNLDVLPDNCKMVIFHGKYDPAQEDIYNINWVKENWK